MRNIPTAMTQDELKQMVAREAIKYIVDDAYLGVGSGSTADFFIDELAAVKGRIKGAVASSIKTAERLRKHAIPVVELTSVDSLPVYIDGGGNRLSRHEGQQFLKALATIALWD